MGSENIINFCIISHIDHGKSTLADRFLELTGTIPEEKMRSQYLDSMFLEKEKGITIKLHPVRMEFEIPNPKSETQNSFERLNFEFRDCLGFRNSSLEFANSEFILNLIDTPGHIDFSYEISRALACVEGAVLLVDATKGIQAQTLFNLAGAREQNLEIIGAVNKIDIAREDQIFYTRKELARLLNQKEEDIFLISAKTGENVKELLEDVIRRIPPPGVRHMSDPSLTPLKALVFDSKYDEFSGVIAFLRIFEGEIKKGDKICLLNQEAESQAREVGFFSPELTPCEILKAGEIGYVKTGIKTPDRVRVGDTIIKLKIKNEKLKISEIKPLPGYKEPQPVLFLSLYPEDNSGFKNLKMALGKLKLVDPSLDIQPESKTILGQGFRLGFLGSLQAEIILRRLNEEFGLNFISTSPQVVFKILTSAGKELEISSPDKWLQPPEIKEIQEPFVKVEIITPAKYFSSVFKLLKNYQVSLLSTASFGFGKTIIAGEAPLRKVIGGGFYNDVKGKTEGYASFSFKLSDFKKADLVKLDILIEGKIKEAFSKIVQREEAYIEGKNFLKKLKKVLPPRQFTLVLQAAVGGRIVARESIAPKRKDVTASLYGGDFSRKKKLLSIQRKGKKKLKERAKVRIPSRVFLEMLKF